MDGLRSMLQGELGEAKLLFRTLALGDVHAGANKLDEASGIVEDWMADTVDVFRRSIRKNDPKVRFTWFFFNHRFAEDAMEEWANPPGESVPRLVVA